MWGPRKHQHSPAADEVIVEEVVRVVIRSGFTWFNKQSHVWQFRLSLNAHIDLLHQRDLHWVSTGRHFGSEVIIKEYVKRIAEAAEVGFSEDVVGVLEIVVTGDADGFREMAREIDLNYLPSSYDCVGQLKGVYLILESDKVALVLYLRQTSGRNIVSSWTLITQWLCVLLFKC